MAPSFESVARFEITMFWCIFTIACWDWIVHLAKEWQFIWKRPGWTMAKSLYVFERYFGLSAEVQVAMLLGSKWTSGQCDFLSRWVPYVNIFVVLGTQCIMLLRLRAIYEGHLLLTCVFGFFLFVELIIHHVIIWHTILPLWIPDPGKTTGFCVGQDNKAPGHVPLAFISVYPAIVDSMMTFLTIWKVRQISQEYGYRSRMLKNFQKHGIIAFLAISLVQITNAVFILQPVESMQAFFNPNMNLFSQIFGCRLILSLYDHKEEASLSLRSTYLNNDSHETASTGRRVARFGPTDLPNHNLDAAGTYRIDDFSGDKKELESSNSHAV